MPTKLLHERVLTSFYSAMSGATSASTFEQRNSRVGCSFIYEPACLAKARLVKNPFGPRDPYKLPGQDDHHRFADTTVASVESSRKAGSATRRRKPT